MAQSITTIRNGLIADLVAAAAAIGITINPNDWVFVPGNLSETDYKLLLLDTVASGSAFQQQVQDLFNAQQEVLIASAPPQTAPWFQNQMLLFQFNATTPQVPQIQPPTAPNGLAVVWNPVVPSYRVIAFCAASFGSAGRCLIKVAAEQNGLPVDLDTAYPGALAAAVSFVNEVAAPGISYVVTSGNSDWLFLQLDVYYTGAYSAVIFSSVQTAITTFLNNLSTTSLNNNSVALLKLSTLEEVILAVPGVQDMEFINVAGRPDVSFVGSSATTWATVYQQYLVQNATELQRTYQSAAGYISLENGTSTGGAIPNSQLNQFRTGSSGVLNLNCIPV